MLSLRDKLKAAGAPKPKAEKPMPLDCMVKEALYPLSSFALPAQISGASLEMMQGLPYADVRREEHPSYELTVTPTGVDSETTRPYTSLTTTELVTVPQSDEWMIS